VTVLWVVVVGRIFESIIAIFIIDSVVDAPRSETLISLGLRVWLTKVRFIIIINLIRRPWGVILSEDRVVDLIEGLPPLKFFEFIENFNRSYWHKLIVSLRLTLILSKCVRRL
jgi:hypothetical protein